MLPPIFCLFNQFFVLAPGCVNYTEDAPTSFPSLKIVFSMVPDKVSDSVCFVPAIWDLLF
jgi:hypothetical protein